MIKSFDSYVIQPTASVLEAMRLLEAKSHKCLFVADKNNKLLATLSDGDVRRFILAGGSPSDPCLSASKSDYLFASSDNFYKVLADARRRDVDIVPVLSNEQILLGYLEVEKRARFYKNTVVLVAGGKGTRLLPLTKDIPKPLLTIGNKPIIHRIIDLYISQGFQHFVLCLGHYSDQIINYIDSSDFPATIEYVVEDTPLGTAGSLFKLSKLKSINYPIVVSNADLLYDDPIYNFIDLMEQNTISGIMLHVPKSYSIDYGVIQIGDDNTWNSIEEKPVSNFCINSGIYLLSRQMIELIKPDVYLDMPSLFEISQLNNLILKTYPLEGFWIDIGKHSEYKLATLAYDEF